MRILTVFGILLIGCPAAQAPVEPTVSVATKPDSAALETTKVEAQQLHGKTVLQGELTPLESVALYARTPSFVESISVDRGSVVKMGQVLARLSAPELQAQRVEAEAKSHSDEMTYQRLRAAAATEGAVAKQEIDQAEALWHASSSRVTALRALEQYLVIKAPFDGVITERGVHPGALVGPPSSSATPPLLRVEQVAKLRLTVAVPESYVSAVKQGVSAEFSVRAWPREKFPAQVQRIAHSLDSRTRTMAVELDVDNAEGRLAPGMFAQAEWPWSRSVPSLLVPPSAVVRTTERTFVDRVHQGTLEQVPVQLGVTVNDKVEVFGALAAGDIILKRGREDIVHGSRVQTAQ